MTSSSHQHAAALFVAAVVLAATVGGAVTTQGDPTPSPTPSPTASEYVTTPEAHGAIGDGKANDWAPIQAAVASCGTQPTGTPCRVVFAARYVSGPIVVNTSWTTLDVRGSLAMLPKKDYPQQPQTPFITNANGDESQCRTRYGGYRVCLQGLRVTGGGVVSSTSPWDWWTCGLLHLPNCWRPHLLVASAVDGVTVDNITFADSPNHNIEVDSCVGVRVSNFHTTEPHFSPNTDGINFYGGFDQSLTDSVISNGDDCVSVVPIGEGTDECARQPESLPCSGGNVVVSNVTCIGGHGISIGGVRHGSVRNVTFENMTATHEATSTQGTYSPGGVRIKSYPNSSGVVEDIHYHNIDMRGVYLPILVQGHYCPWPCTTPDGNTSTLFRDIEFTGIIGTGGQSHTVGQLSCSKLRPCGNITLSGIRLAGSSGGAPAAVIECANAPHVVFDAASSPGSCQAAR